LVVFALVLGGGAVNFGLVESPLDSRSQSSVGAGGGAASTGGVQPTVEPYEEPAPEATDGDSATPSGSAGPPFEGASDRADLEPLSDGDLDTVPGVGPAGITNLTALGEAHEDTLSNRSYTLWLDTYQPRDINPNSTRVQYDTDIAVSGDAYLIVESVEAGRERARLRTVNYDGRDWYVTSHQNGSGETRRIDGDSESPPIQFEPRQLNRGLVQRYLATRTTNVTGKVREGNTTYYRVEGSDRPSVGGVEPIQNYQFVAYVDDDGFVSDATVTYTLVSDAGFYRVQFEWTYGNLDSTTVREPSVATQNDTDDDNPPTLRV
jgi:hypothetical protein